MFDGLHRERGEEIHVQCLSIFVIQYSVPRFDNDILDKKAPEIFLLIFQLILQ